MPDHDKTRSQKSEVFFFFLLSYGSLHVFWYSGYIFNYCHYITNCLMIVSHLFLGIKYLLYIDQDIFHHMVVIGQNSAISIIKIIFYLRRFVLCSLLYLYMQGQFNETCLH